ncbi:uncharacterized protein FIBRA_04475 [Fibroporia radiculosa]|uniref:ferric-chelate reductase (NADPH) n=1 Tax=Fibroporia radiculosa TaxID=599839 RepID=J4GPC0_9APHY|nr:uncharacterized protein FIBRA_04475 [Fibroporia radiculosa]CCM02380.1 predicted protein [Fibroporia radiculosa]
MASQKVTSTLSLTAYPTTPNYSDDQQWITAYLDIHALPDASYVYVYVLWFAIALVLVLLSLLRLTGLGSGFLGAYWYKWAIRRRTWRKKHTLRLAQSKGDPHKQPHSLPSNAQILSLFVFVLLILLLTFAGPDYIVSSSPFLTSTRSPDASPLTQYIPNYTINKAWWTSGNRTGLIAFALFPLCVLLALKSPPFAVLAVPFLVRLYFDKLSWAHKWIGRLIWFFTALHVVLWSVQLAVERRSSTGKTVYIYAWGYRDFVYGWVAFIALTLLVVMSFRSVRNLHYEIFYASHILLVPLTLVFAALHHSQVWWWCWASLALWAGERLWRLMWWFQANGYLGRMLSPTVPGKVHNAPVQDNPQSDLWKMNDISPFKPMSRSPNGDISSSPALSINMNVGFPHRAGFILGEYVPPPGFAHAELLSGRTIRLRLITPGYIPWAPGQHFLLRIPAISQVTTHPFTTATICDQTVSDEGRELVFLVRAKNGWTKRLWDLTAQCMAQGLSCAPGESLPTGYRAHTGGVLMRAYVDGPFGSAVRARWCSYSTVLIVAGGSGVSFGLSVLQYVCHIQWCATFLRRCMELVGAPELQIDVFVTNFKTPLATPLAKSNARSEALRKLEMGGGPAPPTSHLDRCQSDLQDNDSCTEDMSPAEIDAGSVVDLSYYTGEVVEGGELGHEEHVLDLTNFEGDNDQVIPGETQFSISVRKEGRQRRAESQILASGQQLTEEEPDKGETIPPGGTTVRLVDSKMSSLWRFGERHQGDTTSPASRASEKVVSTSPTPTSSSSQTAFSPQHPASPISASSSRTLFNTDSLFPNMKAQNKGKPRERGSSAPTSRVRPLSTASYLTAWSNMCNEAALPSAVEFGWRGEQLRIKPDAQELQDVGIVSEHARPGRPKLDRILAEEVRQAQGAIVVGCCGPLSLNAMMRKTVAAQIDPDRIRRGDMRGSITLISEHFEY